MKYYKIKVNNGSLYRCWIVISGGRSVLSTEDGCAVVSELLLQHDEITKYTNKYPHEFIPVDDIDKIRSFRIYEDII